AVCSFLGTMSEVGYAPYTNCLLNNVSGGWRKTYGITTGDAYDRILAVNGATSGSLPFFKQSGLTLVSGGTYTLAFYGKHANSYAQVRGGSVQDAQLIVEVLDNGNSLVTSGSLNLTAPASWTDDRPEAPWELRMFTFTAPGGSGPFTVQLRASTTAVYGNDFYIDNVVLSPCALILLPLELNGFTGRGTKTNDVVLNWNVVSSVPATAVVEYSYDGSNFAPVGKLATQPDVTDYSFTHYQPGTRANYYRLRIVDATGKTTYSTVIRVDLGAISSSPVMVYPNPVSDRVFIQSTQSVTQADLLDAQGKMLKSTRNSGGSVIDIYVRDLPTGMYYVRLINRNGAMSAHKIVVSR
ncbi:MAG: T9SS type A sorting domain-containing protein, partial [Bacteroidetes bacterium]|nr:T9SS type A sorting domain-containing protein [Bacteroidota bacterium]